MSNELVVRAPTTVVANNQEQLPQLQAPLAGWAQKKFDAARDEHIELTQAVDEARKHKWKISSLQRAANGALKRMTFYEKVVAALEAGYMLFPPVPNADLIAVRTNYTDGGVEWRNQSAGWGSPRIEEHASEAPPIGEGEYKSPWMGWVLWRQIKNEKNEDRKEWKLVSELENAEFPVAMGKPEIIRATSAAMEMKVFDEIRLFPFTKKKGDPCILGSIVCRESRTQERRLYFLISWRINESDL